MTDIVSLKTDKKKKHFANKVNLHHKQDVNPKSVKKTNNMAIKNTEGIENECVGLHLDINEPSNMRNNNHNRKRPYSKDTSHRVGKLSKYDPTKIMNQFEEFSDVWNDCPIVQNPKQNLNHWFGGTDKQLNNNEITEDYRKSVNKCTDKIKQNDNSSFYNSVDKNHEVTEKCSNPMPFKNKIKNKHLDQTLEEKSSKESKINGLKNEHLNESDTKLADIKRKKAVQEQRQVHVDQKNIIKQALCSIDGKQNVNKKIVFSDSEEKNGLEHNDAGLEENKTTNREKLFNDSDDESESEVQLKLNPQFEGKKGQKLLELQSKFASDSRFNLDTRFYESGSDGSDNEVPEHNHQNEEKEKQLAVLESILQKQIKPQSQIKKTSNKKNDALLVRFDPTREDHEQYIVKGPEPKKDEKKEKKKKKIENEPLEENRPQVSSEKFFEMKEDLKEVLKKDNDTEFSLLKLFGNKNIEDPPKDLDQTQSLKKPKHGKKNPFKYDSSESEAEAEKPQPIHKNNKIHPASWKTAFFFAQNDSRFEEALEFFKTPEETEDGEEYAEKRKVLKDFLRNKFKNNTRKKNPFKKKLGCVKRKVFTKRKGKRN